MRHWELFYLCWSRKTSNRIEEISAAWFRSTRAERSRVVEEKNVTLSTYMIDLHFFETSIDMLFPLIQRKEIGEHLITNRTCGIVLFDLCDDRIETFPNGIDLHHGRFFRCCLDQSWTFLRRNEIFIVVFIFSDEGFFLR